MEVFPKILSNSHAKTKYTITTYPTKIIFVTTTKNKETNPNTDNHNTNPYMENKKQTTIWRYNHPSHQRNHKYQKRTEKYYTNTLETPHQKQHANEFRNNFCIDNATCKLTQITVTTLF